MGCFVSKVAIREGEDVEALFAERYWFPAQVLSVEEGGSMTIRWIDGSGTAVKKADEVRKLRGDTAKLPHSCSTTQASASSARVAGPVLLAADQHSRKQFAYLPDAVKKVSTPCRASSPGAESQPVQAQRRPRSTTAEQVAAGYDMTWNAAWVKEVLDAHNRLRAKHGAPPLEWDADCAQKAKAAANACAKRGCLFHNNCQEHGHGQNIFFGTPGHFDATGAIEAWYNEFHSPGYNHPGASGTGHFTQVVWLATTHVGMCCDSLGKGYIVANYSPPGNVQPVSSNYIKNVLPIESPMQKRANVRKIPTSLTATSLTAEVREILDSIPHEEIKAAVSRHLADGNKIDIDFNPPPKGSVAAKLYSNAGCKTLKGSW